MTVKAFISYSFKDKEMMDILRKNLQSEGVECYVSQYDEDYGGILPEKLTSAIDDNDIVMVILTKNGSKSDYSKSGNRLRKKSEKKNHSVVGTWSFTSSFPSRNRT